MSEISVMSSLSRIILYFCYSIVVNIGVTDSTIKTVNSSTLQFKSVVFDIDTSECDAMIPDIMQEYQRTQCFPGYYTIITKTENTKYNISHNNTVVHYLRNSYHYIKTTNSSDYMKHMSDKNSFSNGIPMKISGTEVPDRTNVSMKSRIVSKPNLDNHLLKDNKLKFGEKESQELNRDVGTEWNENEQEQSFWKGERNKSTIREVQAKLMKQYMDDNVHPCEDFYHFACGNWGKLNPIPKDKITFDTFEMLKESLDYVLRELLETPIAKNDTEAFIKAKSLYFSCINYAVIKERGSQPLLQLLKNFGHWPILTDSWNEDTFDLINLMGSLRLYGNDILVSMWVGPDMKNSDEHIIQFDQASLGLSRDYLLQPSNFIYLNAYKNYMMQVALLLGGSPVTVSQDVEDIVTFEMNLAKITSASDERHNVTVLYQRMALRDLITFVPQLDWHRYLSKVLNKTISFDEPVVMFALRYTHDLVTLLSITPPRIVANYLLWRFVKYRVKNLDDRYQEAEQEFYYVLNGREEAPSRWKYCVTDVNSKMGMAVSAMFVGKYFDENSKKNTLTMTREIQQSFNEILRDTTWIGEETKKLASEKVNTMTLKVGYPDFILVPKLLNERYKDVKIERHKYFENTLNILRHLTKVEQGHLGTPVNKSIWNTAPAVVNAYYSRIKNQIMFPAGILQPPFYHKYFPPSLNYGGIGVVIGHEITHGFDDKGRLFDKYGNLHRWWKDEEINNFHERAQCLIEQYSKYKVPEVGITLDGINTQGENIADNGGIKQAFRAYQRWISQHGSEDDTLPGLNATGHQLFFLNFAQVWCGNTRPEALKNALKTAVHPPGQFRVIGPLSNSHEFAYTFNCPPGSPMNPHKKCSVW